MRLACTSFLISVTALSYGQGEPDPIRIADQLRDWLPASAGNYQLSGEPYSSVLLNKEKPYPVASKRYMKENSELMIFIADYRDHDIPAKQVKAWASSPSFDDSKRVGGGITVKGCPAWKSYSKLDNSAILYLVAKERYLLTLTVSQGGTDLLTAVVEGLDLEKLP